MPFENRGGNGARRKVRLRGVSGQRLLALIADPLPRTRFSAEEEARYEAVDRQLYQEIERLFDGVSGSEGNYYQSGDWWPNQLRGIEVAEELYSEGLAGKLRSLLHGEFADFRIVLHVYSELKMGAPHRFTVLLTAAQSYIAHENIGT